MFLLVGVWETQKSTCVILKSILGCFEITLLKLYFLDLNIAIILDLEAFWSNNVKHFCYWTPALCKAGFSQHFLYWQYEPHNSSWSVLALCKAGYLVGNENFVESWDMVVFWSGSHEESWSGSEFFGNINIATLTSQKLGSHIGPPSVSCHWQSPICTVLWNFNHECLLFTLLLLPMFLPWASFFCFVLFFEHHSLNLIVSCYFLINPPLASRVVTRILKIYLDTSKLSILLWLFIIYRKKVFMVLCNRYLRIILFITSLSFSPALSFLL